MIKTDDHNFIRDPSSKAIINTNVEALQQYKKQKKQQEEFNKLKSTVSELKSDISEIKALLKKAME